MIRMDRKLCSFALDKTPKKTSLLLPGKNTNRDGNMIYLHMSSWILSLVIAFLIGFGMGITCPGRK